MVKKAKKRAPSRNQIIKKIIQHMIKTQGLKAVQGKKIEMKFGKKRKMKGKGIFDNIRT